nr:hypothetical protein [Tanacetum cinerariifolium]GEY09179.1 hypothetical protein [Tanacetum cinerariifolium]
MKAVIWNPSIRKCISIVIPNVLTYPKYTVIGFGVCPDDTIDPKLVKININKIKIPYTRVVEVFTFSTRVWKTVYKGKPFKSYDFTSYHVFIDGIIYWRTAERLARSHGSLLLAKVNELLGFLEYYNKGDIWVCGVWLKKDGVNKPFTKIYTAKVEGKSVYSVLGFRNNGEVVLEIVDDNDSEYAVEVYEPSSRHINGVGINGKYRGFSVRLYTETLLLLHESNSIIY